MKGQTRRSAWLLPAIFCVKDSFEGALWTELQGSDNINVNSVCRARGIVAGGVNLPALLRGERTDEMKKYWGPLYLALAASIWGGVYVVSKVVLEVLPALELVWIRYVIALVTLGMVGWCTGVSWKIPRATIPLVMMIGLVGYFISIWAQFAGTHLSSAQMGSVITAATPAFMVLFARILLGEPITLKKALSLGLATVGVLCIVGIGDMEASMRMGGLILGVAAVTWALMSVLVKKIPEGCSVIVVTTYAIFVAMVAMTPLAVSQMQPEHLQVIARPTILSGILYIGTISTAGAFYFWNKGLQLVEAGSGGLYFFFQPLVGTLFGWVFLGEQVGMPFWLGAAMIFAGVLLVIRE
jgi:drug/metabolite transporter (DMT)-like permease